MSEKSAIKLFSILFCMCIIFHSLNSCGQVKGSISGVVIEEAKPDNRIGYATVSVYNAADSSLVAYRLSNPKGLFSITNLPMGKFRLIVSAWQYKGYKMDFEIAEKMPNLNTNTIFLTLKDNSVKEVVILAERPPVIVRKDTVEFNAESFKTLPTAVVEDLLKKLEGVIVDRFGNISFNGKPVNRILVDGKDFFEGKIQIASKNLPSNIVDKVQVMDDEEFKRRNPDALSSEVPQLINLTLKKGIKQGVFGRLYAGTGIKSYYEIGGILNLFRDTSQISVLGYGNNISRSAFSLGEIQGVGGFDRSGYNSLNSSEGGFSIDNISFGGYGEGIQNPSGAGMNFNTVTKSGVKVNTKYFYGLNNILIEQRNDELQYFQNDFLNTQKTFRANNRNESHNISAKAIYNPSSSTRMTFNPSVEFSPRYNLSTQNKVSFNGQTISTSTVDNTKEIYNKAFKLGSDFSKDFSKKGRRLFTAVSFLAKHNTDDHINTSSTLFQAAGLAEITDQLRSNTIQNVEAGIRGNFSEPLSKKLKLSLGFDGTYFDKENALFTFHYNPTMNLYTTLVPSLSETVKQEGVKTNSTARLSWNLGKELSIQPALILGTINISNNFVASRDFNQNFYFLNPGINIQYKQFTVIYEKTFSEPMVQYIQPVQNNTDPLFLQLGTPDLLPSKTHRVYVFFRKYDTKKSTNYSLYINGSVVKDGVIMSRSVDANGVQITKPVNANLGQISHNGGVTKSIRSKARQITLNGSYFVNLFNSPLVLNGIRTQSFRYNAGSNLGFRFNYKDKVEIFENYSLSYGGSRYNNSGIMDRHAFTHNSETELILRWPKNVVFETTMSMQFDPQNIPGNHNLIQIWNAACTYVFMKNNRAQLKVSVNDILQNNIRRYVFIDENYTSTSQYNNIGRYGLLTLSYNIQNYKPKVGGKERFLGF